MTTLPVLFEVVLIEFAKTGLLNKNNKLLKKIENIQEVENFVSKEKFNRKNFMGKKFNNKFKKRKFKKGKFKYYSKSKKSSFDNKKIANF